MRQLPSYQFVGLQVGVDRSAFPWEGLMIFSSQELPQPSVDQELLGNFDAEGTQKDLRVVDRSQNGILLLVREDKGLEQLDQINARAQLVAGAAFNKNNVQREAFGHPAVENTVSCFVSCSIFSWSPFPHRSCVMIFLYFSCFKSTHFVPIRLSFNFRFSFATSALVLSDIVVFHLETRLPLSTTYLFPSGTRPSYVSFVFSSI